MRASAIWTRFYSSRSVYCSRPGGLSSTFLGRPHGDLAPSLSREIDELLDEMRLLELFEECGPAT